MPTLTWVGKDKVVNHHHEVPFRVLNKQYAFEASPGNPTNSTDNRIIHGDNLEALKSLLPEFEGKVKCIYIDPPYNTGNEGWIYNDAVNDPKMRKWLGEVVGKEGEDLSRHDKWLCMMYPRLVMLKQFLREDGAIFISIDDCEVASLKFLLDEIFGRTNFVVQIEWQKRYTRSNNTAGFTTVVEHILVYAKSSAFSPNLVEKGEEADARYTNPDNDPRGPWKAIPFLNPLSPAERPNLVYDIVQPNTGEILLATRKAWRASRETYEQYLVENRLYWGKDGKARTPTIKRFLAEVRDGMPPINFWDHRFAAHTDTANQELKDIFGDKSFPTPKPSQLIQRVLQIATDKDSLILDSFAGSGTTGHAVLKQNAADRGKRRFILVEMDDNIARNVTAERVKRVATGYTNAKGQAVEGLGGGFDYYTIGEPLFTADDLLNEAVGIEAIRGYVAYTEGIRPEDQVTPDNPVSPYLIGRNSDTAWFFYYEPDHATALDMEFLGGIQIGDKPGTTIIYADRCLLSSDFMTRNGLIFKKIPRDISRF